MPTQMFVSVICRCHQITTSIGTRYRSSPKVSVSEVSVNCGIGLTLVIRHLRNVPSKVGEKLETQLH